MARRSIAKSQLKRQDIPENPRMVGIQQVMGGRLDLDGGTRVLPCRSLQSVMKRVLRRAGIPERLTPQPVPSGCRQM